MNDGNFSLALDLSPAGEGGRAREPAGEQKPRKRRAAPGEAAGTRNEHDRYDTRQECADGCAAWLARVIFPSEPAVARVLDPCAGGGAFVRAARKAWPNAKILATDIDVRAESDCAAAGADKFVLIDALTISPATIAACDLILTNPPFKLAEDLVRHFWPHMREGASLAFLLSVTFQAGADRWYETSGLYAVAPLAACPPIIPRPEFGMDSGPKFEAGLFVFTKGVDSDSIVFRPPVRWERPPKPRKPRAKKGAMTEAGDLPRADAGAEAALREIPPDEPAGPDSFGGSDFYGE